MKIVLSKTRLFNIGDTTPTHPHLGFRIGGINKCWLFTMQLDTTVKSPCCYLKPCKAIRF